MEPTANKQGYVPRAEYMAVIQAITDLPVEDTAENIYPSQIFLNEGKREEILRRTVEKHGYELQESFCKYFWLTKNGEYVFGRQFSANGSCQLGVDNSFLFEMFGMKMAS